MEAQRGKVNDFLTTTPVMVLWEWLSERLGLAYSTDFFAIGRVIDNTIVGVVGYNNFTGTSCHMHMAGDGPRWGSRTYLYEAFRYPFEILGLKMVFGVVPSGNTHALQVDLRMGFKELIYIPGAHPDGGIHILQMKKEDCRWLRKGDGKKVYSEST